ncbi:MAG: hypothetical protein AB7I18_01910 [Candidatus Berkiella sp.]
MRLFFALGLTFAIISTPALGESKRELQFENEKVKVWKTTIPPNDKLKMHRHDHARVIVGLQGGKLVKVEETGEKSDLVFETGKAYWFEKDPVGELHGDINLSTKPIEVMVIEFKDHPSSSV